ncbi:tRNA (N6-threonylcarbamoyladenosine(37)-N6)-methyltransferase TrmO [Megalodesulfovibrio paquesii]
MTEFAFSAIGVLKTPHTRPESMPIQPAGARGVPGEALLAPHLAAGLLHLEGFSHVILLYVFHEVGPRKLQVTPFLDARAHGVFATRAPCRPNPIGLSVVRLRGVEGVRLLLEDVDMLDGSPLLDVKPFVPSFDVPTPDSVRLGWLAERHDGAGAARSDDRFQTP